MARRIRTRPFRLLTQLNLHVAVVSLLLLFDLVLGTRLLVAWHDSHSDQSAQYNADLATYAQLQAQSARLQALPGQLAGSRRQADTFVSARIPGSDSEVLAELGVLTTRNHVRLSRANYVPRPAISGLVEMRMDANVSGDYTAVMHFVNDVERDRNHAFFIIRSIVLTGQQGGLVNLRIVMTTYLRTDAANAALLQPVGAGGDSGASGADPGEVQ